MELKLEEIKMDNEGNRSACYVGVDTLRNEFTSQAQLCEKCKIYSWHPRAHL